MRHLPLLRIDDARHDVEIDGRPGALVALPFAEYDELIMHAFTAARRDYEATAPVFFVRELERPIPDGLATTGSSGAPVEFDPRAAIQALVGDDFNQFTADTALLRAAINLAVPRAAVPDPILSLGLVNIAGDRAAIATTQGHADQELLFLSSATTAPLTASELERVRSVLDIVRRADGELGVAVQILGAAADVALGPGEQLALCAITLEALLLPDLKTGLRRAFMDRAAALIARPDDERQRVATAAGAVHAARSTFVHGGGKEPPRGYRAGMAQTLLAQAIVTLDAATTSGATLSAVRAELAQGRSAIAPHVDLSRLPLPPLDDREPVIGPRLYPRVQGIPPVTWSPDLPIVEQDELVLFAPLVGLGLDTLPQSLIDDGFPLTWMSTSALVALENRDIRGDWIAQIARSAEAVAVIALRDEYDNCDSLFKLADVGAALDPLRQWRNAAVLALRLAGLSRFYDPEMLGDYVLCRRNSLCRLPSIYRQTLLNHLTRHPPDRLPADGGDDLHTLWSLLRAYASGQISPTIENALTLFRRAHNPLGMQPATRALLLYAALDIALGRPSGGESVDLMTRLAEVIPAELGSQLHWYTEHGHPVRNAVAHGYWDAGAAGPRGGEAIAYMADTLRIVLPALLGTWLLAPRDDDPAKAFRAAIDAGSPNLDWRQFRSRVPDDQEHQRREDAIDRRYSASDTPRMLQLATAAMEQGDADTARVWLTQAAQFGSALAMNIRGVLEKASRQLRRGETVVRGSCRTRRSGRPVQPLDSRARGRQSRALARALSTGGSGRIAQSDADARPA
jgi:hypothetical protein